MSTASRRLTVPLSSSTPVNNSSTNQQWAIAEVSSGVVRLTAHHSGKVAEVNKGATADGTPSSSAHGTVPPTSNSNFPRAPAEAVVQEVPRQLAGRAPVAQPGRAVRPSRVAPLSQAAPCHRRHQCYGRHHCHRRHHHFRWDHRNRWHDCSARPGPQHPALDLGWLFNKGDATGADQAAFADTTWRPVNLPHDWAIEGPFSQSAATTGRGAMRRRESLGTKAFHSSARDLGRRVSLNSTASWRTAPSTSTAPSSESSLRLREFPLRHDGEG